MKNTIYILTTCLILLFSCQPEVEITQEILTQEQLNEKLLSLDAFHQFLEAEQKLEQKIEDRRKNLDQKDLWWLLNIHEKYPKIENFLEKASSRSIRKYSLLSGIDVAEGNSKIKTLLQQIHEELSKGYVFQISDLNELLFFANNTEEFEEAQAKSNCLRYCDREAKDEFEKVLESCERDNLSYCQHRALMARHYFHIGCMRGCNHQE